MSGAASLPGAALFAEIYFLGKEPLVPGSFAALGRTLYIYIYIFHFFGKSNLSQASSLPGAELFLKFDFLLESHLSQAASLPGAELFT